jgi:hypothetical protein
MQPGSWSEARAPLRPVTGWTRTEFREKIHSDLIRTIAADRAAPRGSVTMPDRHQLDSVLTEAAGTADHGSRTATAYGRGLQEVQDTDQVQVRIGPDGSGRDSFGEFQRVTSSEPA